MKFGIYARGLSEKTGGAKRYIYSMTRAIIKNLSPNDKLYIFHNLPLKQFFDKSSNKANVEEILLKSRNKVFCDFVEAPRKINSLDLDVMWFPKNVIPFGIKAKKIVSVLDLAYFIDKMNAYTLKDTFYMKRMIKNSCRRADIIIAISKHTKKDIERFCRINKDKIKVIYPGTDKNYKRVVGQMELERVRRKYNLPLKFILFTGNISPRKNLIRMAKAFSLFNKDFFFVITGPHAWNEKQEIKALAKEKIKRIGFVEEKDMPALYSLASLFVYPSLYEGFGLPILEAQACNCPVLASNASSIPEVGGDSVQYINPYNVNDIYRGIIKILNDTKYRNELVKKGFRNIKKFSWDKSAKELLKVIKENG